MYYHLGCLSHAVEQPCPGALQQTVCQFNSSVTDLISFLCVLHQHILFNYPLCCWHLTADWILALSFFLFFLCVKGNRGSNRLFVPLIVCLLTLIFFYFPSLPSVCALNPKWPDSGLRLHRERTGSTPAPLPEPRVPIQSSPPLLPLKSLENNRINQMQALEEVRAGLSTLLSHLQSKENDWLQLGPLTVIRDIRGLYIRDGLWPQLQHIYNTCRKVTQKAMKWMRTQLYPFFRFIYSSLSHFNSLCEYCCSYFSLSQP